MRCRFRAERGSVTAEFAAVMPAVVLVLVVALASMQLAGEQLRLQSAAGDAARLAGRGAGGELAALQRVSPGAHLAQTDNGDLVCIHADAPAGIGILAGLTLAATSCALKDGG
jgi:hypothetical protein